LNTQQTYRTLCRECVLAEYEGDTQSGCKLGRIEKFEARGIPVVGLDDGVKKYLSIGTFCNACHTESSKYLASVPPGDWPRHIRWNVARLHYAAIVILDRFSTLDDLKKTIDALALDELPPSLAVIVLYPQGKIRLGQAIGVAREYEFEFGYKVVAVEPPSDSEVEAYPDDYFRLVDEGVRQIDSPKILYYVTVIAAESLPEGMMAKLDRTINDEMQKVGAIADKWFIYAVLVGLHRHPLAMGNRGEPLINKLEWLRLEASEAFEVLTLEELEL
jgi:hypothetical protein